MMLINPTFNIQSMRNWCQYDGNEINIYGHFPHILHAYLTHIISMRFNNTDVLLFYMHGIRT